MVVNGSHAYQTTFQGAFPLSIPPGGYSDFAFQMQVDMTRTSTSGGGSDVTVDDADSGFNLFFNAIDAQGQVSQSAIHVSCHQHFCGDGMKYGLCLDTVADVINLKEADGEWHTTTFSNSSRTLNVAVIRIAESW